MKLKTYNDLFDDSGDSHGCGMVDFERVRNLRKEVIKDIKELRKASSIRAKEINKILGTYAEDPVIEYIKWKFNTIEEDIK